MAITINFQNRQESIEFLSAFGMPHAVAALKAAEREEAYGLALALVDALEPDPRTGRLSVHWRTRAGVLLHTLDEVVQAALAGDIANVA